MNTHHSFPRLTSQYPMAEGPTARRGMRSGRHGSQLPHIPVCLVWAGAWLPRIVAAPGLRCMGCDYKPGATPRQSGEC
jgi:hypothetical protein